MTAPEKLREGRRKKSTQRGSKRGGLPPGERREDDRFPDGRESLPGRDKEGSCAKGCGAKLSN